MDAAALRAAIARFHDLHEELHAYAVRDEEPVLRALRVQVTARTPRPALPELAPARAAVAAALRSRRPVCFGAGFVDTPVYDGERLAAGHRVAGPAILEERFTAIVVPPGWTAELDRGGNCVVTREALAADARPGEAA
jgi:N-methylhydantoinase A